MLKPSTRNLVLLCAGQRNLHGFVRHRRLSPEASDLQPGPLSTQGSQTRKQKQPLRVPAAMQIVLPCTNSGILHPGSKGVAIPSRDTPYRLTQSAFHCRRHRRVRKKPTNFKHRKNKKLFQTPCTVTKVPGKTPAQPSLLSPRQRECEKPAEIWCPWGEPRSQEC